MKTKNERKNQLTAVFGIFRMLSEIIRNITGGMKPVVVDAVDACVEMAGNIRFTLDETVRRLTRTDMAGDYHWGRLHRLHRQGRTITDAHGKHY